MLSAEGQADAIRDIPFVERPERTLLMNIHRPKGERYFPVLLYIYGGSYVSGDRDVLSEQGDILKLTRDGVAVVTFDYRYSQEAVFPAQILDVTAALC